MSPEPGFSFRCPACGSPLEAQGPKLMICPREGISYPLVDGIWRLLSPGRAAYFDRFIHEYETIRAAEGRGSENPAWYRALPYVEDQGWPIRARSFEWFMRSALPSIEAQEGPLRILDIGAGTGWLAARLAARGHQAIALDLITNTRDGLGAYGYFDPPFVPVQAEFDALPLAAGSIDLLLFNAALHYSIDTLATLREALTVIAPGGWLGVIDTPVYFDGASGAQMVRERQAAFVQQVGFASDALPSENYLTHHRIRELSAALGIQWRLLWPVPPWRVTLRRLRTRLRGQREAAHFPILIARKDR